MKWGCGGGGRAGGEMKTKPNENEEINERRPLFCEKLFLGAHC